MSRPLTHRERAERAADAVRPGATPGTVGEDWSHKWAELAADAIARETFPWELVKAARKMAARLDEIMEHPSYQNVFTMAAVHGNPYSGPSWEQPLNDLRSAIALYEEEADRDRLWAEGGDTHG